jgi:hypothetical protein
MDGYGINITTRSGSRRYRHGGQDEFDLREATDLAADLLERNTGTLSVTVGNGEHEFRLIGPDADIERHASWYVDVQIGELRWQYRPMADLGDYGDADGLAEEAAALYPDVTKIWVGRSDGSEEYESGVDAG